MRLDNFDLNLLVAFEVLMEERSVTGAARRMNVTQSAMSAALKRLRTAFQDELLVLHRKKMVPTQHALALAPEVALATGRLRGLIASGTAFDPATSKRRFRIDASDYITTVLLAPLIAELQAEAPGVRLELSLPNEDSRTRLDNAEIDLIITPEEFMDDVHPRELLFEEHHVVVGWEGNVRLKNGLDHQTFLDSGHVAVRISYKDTFMEAVLRKVTPERRIEVVAHSFIQVPWLLRGTDRLAVMHERLARICAPLHQLRVCAPPIDLPPMREMMQHHLTRTRDPGLSWLRRRLSESAASC